MKFVIIFLGFALFFWIFIIFLRFDFYGFWGYILDGFWGYGFDGFWIGSNLYLYYYFHVIQ